MLAFYLYCYSGLGLLGWDLETLGEIGERHWAGMDRVWLYVFTVGGYRPFPLLRHNPRDGRDCTMHTEPEGGARHSLQRQL